MKKAIIIWSFADKTVKESIKLAKDAGFEGIELALNEAGEISLESSKEELLGIKAFADEIGIKIHSFTTGLYWSYSFTSNEAVKREKAYKVAVKQLQSAKILGADTALIIPGHVSVSFAPGLGVVEYDVAYERALAAINKLKPLAEELEINIGIENVWNNFLLSPLEMRDFIDKIDSPYVGAYFDVGNVVATGYPEHWIKILGKRIKKVHFKDYRIEPGGLRGFVDLLSGDVNWPAVTDAFQKAGYDGWATGEMIPPYKYYSDQIIYNTSKSMDRILGDNNDA